MQFDLDGPDTMKAPSIPKVTPPIAAVIIPPIPIGKVFNLAAAVTGTTSKANEASPKKEELTSIARAKVPAININFKKR